MKPCVHVSSSPTLQLSRPYAAHKALPCSFPSLSSSRKIAGKDYASLLWVRVRGRCLKPLHLTVFVLNKDGGAKKHEDEWYATDASRVKLLTWGILQRWGSPAAVGAMVGSIVARKTLVFVVSFSFIVLMAVHKVMEAQGVHLDIVSHVLSRQDYTNFLARMKSIFSTVIMNLSCAIMTCFIKSCKFICQLTVPMRSLLAKTSLTWNQRQLREIVKIPALGSEFKSADTLIIADINACIQNVEGMIKIEKDIHTDTKWTELKDNLSSLKTRVAFLSKVDRYTVPSTDVLAPPSSDFKVPVKKPKSSASVKSKGSNAQQSKVDKMRATREDKMLVNTSVDMLKQEAMHEIPGELDVMNAAGDVSPTERVASTKWASAAASEAAVDLGSGLPFKEINGIAVSDAQPLDVASVNIGESESRSPRPKYIDYWAEQDPIRSASSGDVEEQNNNALSKNLYYEREGSVLRTGQDLEKKIASKVLSPDLGRKSFYSDECTSSVNNEVGSKNAGSRTDISVKVRDGDGSGRSVDSQRAPGKSSSVNHSKVAGCINVKDEAILNGSQNPLLGANVKKDDVVEQGTAVLGSTKELAFVRENADLHVLTGFSRSFNDGEFQKLMNDGETALRHGKAGLFGDIEVNEAETMLYKAADHFASAAALDLSSVEAVGLWGNTLLVHGELKLMLSRELRHLISTPDVISPYWIRQNKGMETREKSNRTVLQRTFQTVCEECEELLIQAGRKYRTVLSISSSEVRALYNWGLALCFRAQLIAEEGGQDAREAADRIYLAAIDKFEAMMGISQRYAPGAMLNWGLTLKDRSRLWASDSAERISLLQQAKQLFFDALRLQPDDAQIHSAFVTCCVELKELNERQDSQSKRSMKTFFGK